MRRPPTVRSALVEFQPAGFFVVRSATLPFETLTEWGRPTDEGDTAQVLADRLRAIVAPAEIRERLFLASPSIDERLDDWLARATPPEESRRIEQALGRYVERMAWRSTPFGLFAGTSVGRVGAESKIAFGPRAHERRATRLDTAILSALGTHLARDPAIRGHLVYRPNTSLHLADDDAWFVEARVGPGSKHRSAVATRTPALDVVLRVASHGATPAQLAAAIVDADPSVPQPTAERFVQALIDVQVLVDALEPPIVGADPLAHLIDRLEGIDAAAAVRARLLRARDALARIDAWPEATPAAEYRALARSLGEHDEPLAPSGAFHVVLSRPVVEATLDERFLREVLAGVGALHAACPPPRDRLVDFARDFAARYGDQDVPLQEALSDARGLGFERALSSLAVTPPLLRGLTPPAASPPRAASWGAREEWLAARVAAVLRSRSTEIALDDSALEALSGDRAPLPDSFSVVASVHGENTRELGEGRYRVHLRQIVSPTGGSMLGRFASTDAVLADHLRHLAAREEALAPDAVVAEIVHTAHPWSGNVANRPAVRRYEIPFLGASASSDAIRIPLSDLTVSARGRRVLLRSRSLGRRVIPRMTYADNISLQGVPEYRFLAFLASQSSLPDGWTWGPLELFPDLPRVTYGRCILALARWRLDAATTSQLEAASLRERVALVRRLREDRGLPRWVALLQGDKSLPIDTDNAASVDATLQIVGGQEIVLEEMFPGPGAPLLPGPEGRHAHELVLPFLRKEPRVSSEPARVVSHASRRRRARLPGEDWLYAKLYCEERATDRVLRDVVLPLVDASDGQRWFFLRYGDPDWHVRLRIHGDPELLRARTLPELTRLAGDARDRGWIRRMTLDTYEPEIERYGGPVAMEWMERVFHHDSEAALHLTVAYADGDARWRLALAGIHRLLARLAPDLAVRQAIANRARDDFAQELGLVGRHARPIGERFRREKAALTALVRGEIAADDPLRLGLDILDERDVRLTDVARAVADACSTSSTSAPNTSDDALSRVAISALHMHANRVLESHHRAQEAVLYDLLSRLLLSERIRPSLLQPSRDLQPTLNS